jgi:hypothetical protein
MPIEFLGIVHKFAVVQYVSLLKSMPRPVKLWGANMRPCGNYNTEFCMSIFHPSRLHKEDRCVGRPAYPVLFPKVSSVGRTGVHCVNSCVPSLQLDHSMMRRFAQVKVGSYVLLITY